MDKNSHLLFVSFVVFPPRRREILILVFGFFGGVFLFTDLEEAFEAGGVVDFESFGFDVADEVCAVGDAYFSFGGDAAVQVSLDFEVLDAESGADMSCGSDVDGAAGFDVGDEVVGINDVVFEVDASIAEPAIDSIGFGADLEQLAAMGALAVTRP